jgi:hypothetical protein
LLEGFTAGGTGEQEPHQQRQQQLRLRPHKNFHLLQMVSLRLKLSSQSPCLTTQRLVVKLLMPQQHLINI